MAFTVSAFNATAPCIGVAVTSTAGTSAALPGQGSALRLVNEGPNIAFLSLALNGATATSVLPGSSALQTCTPVPVGDIVLSIRPDQILNFSLITRAAQTAQVSIQVGEGV